jgi:uncharacterized protein
MIKDCAWFTECSRALTSIRVHTIVRSPFAGGQVSISRARAVEFRELRELRMAELVLHVQNIDEAGRDYAFELTHAWLDATLRDAALRADPAYGPGQLQVHAQQNGGAHVGNEYLVNGTLQAHLLTECGRCLADAKVAVDTVLATLFSRVSGKALPVVQELSEDDLQREEFVGQEIVLDHLVREHLVLEVPMQPLCSPDCQGIPVPERVRPPPDVFASAGNVDPRLAPLQRLRDKVPPAAEPQANVNSVNKPEQAERAERAEKE